MIEFHWKGELDPIAVYAAVVSTIAAGLTGWNYFRDRARLRLTVTPETMLIGSGDPDLDEEDLIAVRVINRGMKPTTITGLYFMDCGNRWNTFWRSGKTHYAVINPQPKNDPPNLPKELKPNEQWTGYIRLRPDLAPNIGNGCHVAFVGATHSDRTSKVVIPKFKNSAD